MYKRLKSLLSVLDVERDENVYAEWYLGLSAGGVHQVLTGHLDGLFGFGKLSRIHQTLLSSMAVRVRHPHQISTLQKRVQLNQELVVLKKKKKGIDYQELAQPASS